MKIVYLETKSQHMDLLIKNLNGDAFRRYRAYFISLASNSLILSRDSENKKSVGLV